jgi:hypothetical protein
MQQRLPGLILPELLDASAKLARIRAGIEPSLTARQIKAVLRWQW